MIARLACVGISALLAAQCAARSGTEHVQARVVNEAALDAAVPLPDGVFRVGDPGVTPPAVVKRVYAHYTSQALRDKVRGSVVLRAIVRPSSAVTDVVVLKSLEPGMDEASSNALAQWTFRPGTRDGAAVSVAVTVQMSFTTP